MPELQYDFEYGGLAEALRAAAGSTDGFYQTLIALHDCNTIGPKRPYDFVFLYCLQ